MKKIQNAIAVINFSKYFLSNNIIRNASFEVPAGAFCGFVGANGAGKTTIIKSIIDAYSEHRFNGQIKIFSQKHNSKNAKKLIGYIPEKAIFPSGMSVFDYLKGLAFVGGSSWKDAKQEANRVITLLGLQKFAKKSPTKFSSGEQKKVLLAQAIINDPKILIMDEPCANLDPMARQYFFNYLIELNRQGTTIFISSHILAELENYISHVIMIDKGEIIFQGALSDALKGFNTDQSIYEITFEGNVPTELLEFMREKAMSFEESKSKLRLNLKNRNELTQINGFLFGKQIDYVSINKVEHSLQDALINKIKDSNQERNA